MGPREQTPTEPSLAGCPAPLTFIENCESGDMPAPSLALNDTTNVGCCNENRRRQPREAATGWGFPLSSEDECRSAGHDKIGACSLPSGRARRFQNKTRTMFVLRTVR